MQIGYELIVRDSQDNARLLPFKTLQTNFSLTLAEVDEETEIETMVGMTSLRASIPGLEFYDWLIGLVDPISIGAQMVYENGVTMSLVGLNILTPVDKYQGWQNESINIGGKLNNIELSRQTEIIELNEVNSVSFAGGKTTIQPVKIMEYFPMQNISVPGAGILFTVGSVSHNISINNDGQISHQITLSEGDVLQGLA